MRNPFKKLVGDINNGYVESAEKGLTIVGNREETLAALQDIGQARMMQVAKNHKKPDSEIYPVSPPEGFLAIGTAYGIGIIAAKFAGRN